MKAGLVGFVKQLTLVGWLVGVFKYILVFFSVLLGWVVVFCEMIDMMCCSGWLVGWLVGWVVGWLLVLK